MKDARCWAYFFPAFDRLESPPILPNVLYSDSPYKVDKMQGQI